jgi:hypothetical protein
MHDHRRNAVEQRLRVLERRQRILVVVVAAMGLAMVIGMSSGRNHDELTVRRLVVVGPGDTPLIELDGTDHGGRIVVRTPAKKDLLRLDADWRGGSVRAYRADGVLVASMHAYSMTADKVAGMIETFDWRGRPATTLGCGLRGPGSVAMGAGCDGGVVVLSRNETLHRIDACWLDEIAQRLARLEK